MKSAALVVLLQFVVGGIVSAQFSITIDGKRDDFYNTQKGPDEGHIFLPPQAVSAYTGTGADIDDIYDLSAHVWLAWDETYLYCYAEVWDDIVLVNNATSWENDGLELKIDPDPLMQSTAGIAAVRLTALGKDMADNPAGVDNLVDGNELDEPFSPVEGEDYARFQTVLGYNLEFRLPFSVIVRAGKYVDNSVGSLMGLGINLLENDNDRSECTLTWSAAMNDYTWYDPRLLGTITFLEDHKFKMEPVNSAGGDAKCDSAHWFIPPATAVQEHSTAPARFELAQNYPNPFNPSTTLAYSLDTDARATLEVFDLLGNKIRTLQDGFQPAGRYTAVWDGRDDAGNAVSAGVYLCRLTCGGRVLSGKMTLLK